MRVPIGNDEWYLCDWSDRPDHEYIEFRGSATLALQWAHQFDSDFFAQATLRTLLGSHHPPLSNEQTVREVAWRLTSGIWLARRPIIQKPSADSGVPEEAPAFPREDRRSTPQRASGPEPEAPLFPADIDAVAIAEAQKQAAALGIPFCEECLRAQMANR